jgi:hypothetical protein
MEQPVLKQEQIESIKRRLHAATPGPWESHGYGHMQTDKWNEDYYSVWTPGVPGSFYPNVRKPIVWDEKYLTGNDCEFIAHAPTDIADLLSEVKRLRNELYGSSASGADVGYPSASEVIE